MRHKTTARFWRLYNQLPEDVQRRADRCYDLLRENPRHPSLQLKKVGRAWSARVGLDYRVLAKREPGDVLVWFWIGSHQEYDQLIAGR